MRCRCFLAPAVCLAFIAACSKGDASRGETESQGDRDTAELASPGAEFDLAGVTDPAIFYLMDRAHAMDSSAGSVAATKGTSGDVRTFARLMVTDHHNLRVQGQDLARRLAITPAPPPGDSMPAKLQRTMAMLSGAAQGRDFDKAYIDHEVNAHKDALQLLASAMNAAQNAELKNLIQKATPIIQGHLDRAQEVQGRSP